MEFMSEFSSFEIQYSPYEQNTVYDLYRTGTVTPNFQLILRGGGSLITLGHNARVTQILAI